VSIPMAEPSPRDKTIEDVARLIEESSFGTDGALQLRDRVSISVATEIRARAHLTDTQADQAWWEANRHAPDALRIRAACLAAEGNLEASDILARFADWQDQQDPSRSAASLTPDMALATTAADTGDWRTFETFYRRERDSLCRILRERTGLPLALSKKLIAQAMSQAFDEWEHLAASGDPGEWVLGCALQHYRTWQLPDEDGSRPADGNPVHLCGHLDAAGALSVSRAEQSAAVRVAGALAVAASQTPALRAKTGDDDPDRVITGIYRREYNSLVRLAVLLVHDAETAEEVVQDAFEAMQSVWHRLGDSSMEPSSYLRQTVVNKARSVLRHRTIADKHAPKPAPDEPSAELGALDIIERSAVVAALRSLPDRQREAIVLRYYADLSEAQIAATMGISKGAVKSHTIRAMSALRAAISEAETQGPMTDSGQPFAGHTHQ
jgi:RNA polymerase sigma-70 factor (sigma-E family)